MSLSWLVTWGLSARNRAGKLSDNDVVKMDELLLADAIQEVLDRNDPDEMIKALKSVKDSLIRPRAIYRLKIVARRRGAKADLQGFRKEHDKQLAVAKSVYRRQAADGGRMKRAVADAADEFNISRPSVYRALGALRSTLTGVVDRATDNQSRELLARFFGFVVPDDFEFVDEPPADTD